LIYLDTHAVVWLYTGLIDRFSETAKSLLNGHDLIISPIVRLELRYLQEIGRLIAPGETVVMDLSKRIGLQVCDQAFARIVTVALDFSWTRDPFDRLIVANAALNETMLLSKDQNILTHYAQARW
jgi:PIN domain nuclease of toxin-antitoxin system